jgi:nitrogen fixation protein NifQ
MPALQGSLRGAGLHGLLMAKAAGLPNDDLFARMLVSQAGANSALPAGLGLDSIQFRTLMSRHFPGFGLPSTRFDAPDQKDRRAEWDDLHQLLLEFRAGHDPSEEWMAIIVATACMADDHLWQDLGLWSRVDLSRLMAGNFPQLTARNVHDMKWKRFLYKQLCDREGVYVCRSPSCQVCTDYAKSFGQE